MNEKKLDNSLDIKESKLESTNSSLITDGVTGVGTIKIDENKYNISNKTSIFDESGKLNIKKNKKQNNYFSIANLKIPFLSYFSESDSKPFQKIIDSKDSINFIKSPNNSNSKIPTPKVFRSTDYTLIDQVTLNELDNLRAELKEGVDFKLCNFKGDLSTELDEKIKNEFKNGIDWEIDNFKNELKKTTINFQKNNQNYIDKISWKTFSLGFICNSIAIYYLYKKYLKV